MRAVNPQLEVHPEVWVVEVASIVNLLVQHRIFDINL